jgi:hypothetical protein
MYPTAQEGVLNYPRSTGQTERRRWHLPRLHSPKASCIAQRERSEGQHLREDKATRRRHCLAFLSSVVCRWVSVWRVAHVGKRKRPEISAVSIGPRRRRGDFELDSIASPLLPLPLFYHSPENMSAVRRGDRRAERSQHSSPYNRPNAQPKKSVRPYVYFLPTLPVVGSYLR